MDYQQQFLLNESVTIYDNWTLDIESSRHDIYTFESPYDTYEVIIKEPDALYPEWLFKTVDGYFNDNTGYGDMLNIVYTNMHIIDEWLDNNSHAQGFRFEAEPRRKKIYNRIIERFFDPINIDSELKHTYVTIYQ